MYGLDSVSCSFIWFVAIFVSFVVGVFTWLCVMMYFVLAVVCLLVMLFSVVLKCWLVVWMLYKFGFLWLTTFSDDFVWFWFCCFELKWYGYLVLLLVGVVICCVVCFGLFVWLCCLVVFGFSCWLFVLMIVVWFCVVLLFALCYVVLF